MTSYFQFRLKKLNLRDQRTFFESERLLRHRFGVDWPKFVAQRSYSKNYLTFKRYSFDDHFVFKFEIFGISQTEKDLKDFEYSLSKLSKPKNEFLLHISASLSAHPVQVIRRPLKKMTPK